MQKIVKKTLLIKALGLSIGVLGSALLTSNAWAEVTPVGVWTNVDDKTGEKKAEITITEENGVLTGKITKRLLKSIDPNAICTPCTDDRKDKPIMGLEIIRGVKREGKTNVWDDGTIIDPESGSIYAVKLTPSADGQKLAVRGYKGFSVLGRTQTWLRVQ